MNVVVYRVCCRACVLLALLLAACQEAPMMRDVLAQATPGGRVAFDVVKLDDAVVNTVLAQPQPAFQDHFKKYQPPAELKIAVGDTISIVIWESGANGLFGTSLTEMSMPAGAVAKALTALPSALEGVPAVPQGLTVSPETLGLLSGAPLAADSATAGPGATLAGPGAAAAALGAAAGLDAGAQPGGAAARSTQSDGSPGGAAEPQAASSSQSGRARAAAGGLLAGGALSGQPETAETAADAGGNGLAALLDAAEQTGRAGTRIPDQQVGSDGGISVPYSGRLKVAGRTPAEVEQMIEKRLGPRALDPQALVVVQKSVANSVAVAGEVIGGKQVPLSPGGDRLLQVIAAAGGAKAPVHETFVRLSRGGVTATAPLASLVANPAEDIYVEPGDVLTLVRRRQSFSVFGATGKNSTINFIGDRLTLSEALARAGGLLDDAADPRAVFLFRYEPTSLVRALGQPIATDASSGVSPVVYRLDLSEAKSYLLAKRFPVHDKDIIFVASAEIRPVYRFFEALNKISGPIVTGLLVCQSGGC